MKKIVGVVAFACLAGAASFSATAATALKAGNLEMGFNGAMQSPDEGDDSILMLGSLGYFFTDQLEGMSSLTYFESAGTDAGLLGLGADYHFGELAKDLVPFAGGSYTLTFGDITDTVDTDFLEVHAGIKNFLSERASLEFQIQRLMATDSEFDDANSTVLSVGFNFYL